MANKRDLKAYVRYDGTGRVIAGSLILQRFKPKVGNWKETAAYECCNPIPPGPISCNNFWINNVENPLSPNDLIAVGSAIDSKCNSFMVMNSYVVNPNNPNESSDQNMFLQKFNDSGTLIWEKGIDFMEDGVSYSFMDAETVAIDKDDNIIIFTANSGFAPNYNRTIGVTKLDNDGNYLWSINTSLDESSSAEYVTSIKFDSFNNIYVGFRNNTSPISIGVKKISASGVLLATKYINFYSTECYLEINSSNEIYLITTEYSDSVSIPFKDRIIKLDSSLNEIWNKSIEVPYNTIYMYGIGLDENENVVFQMGNGISSNAEPLFGTYVKISPSGSVIWTTKVSNVSSPNLCLGTYQLNSDPNGNIYISSIYPSPIPGYTGNVSNAVVMAKISSNGIFEWAYVLEGSNTISGWYWYTPISGNISNNSLLLAYYDNEDPYNCQLFKLLLTLLPNGAYGPYTVTNITNLWTTSSPTLTLSDDTATYINGNTDVTPLTYVDFAQASTITHITL